MTFPPPHPRRLTRLLRPAAVAAGWVAVAPLPAPAQPGDAPAANTAAASAAPAVQAVRQMTLGECLAIAQDRQPAVRAALLSQSAGQRGYQALLNLPRIAEYVSPDVPVRREQARRGLDLAAAAVEQARQEATYDVTYLYYSYVYASQQSITAGDILVQLEIFYKVALDLLERGGLPGQKLKIDRYSVFNLENKIGEIRQLKVKADTGRQRALEALKEAMGVDPSFDFVPKDPELHVMGGTVTKERVVELALARRPELIQAAAGVDAFRLEVCAQSKLRTFGQTSTFAAGSDLHAKSVPAPLRNGEYKPGAFPPEMPTTLVGRREDRVARACDLSAKQDVLYEKAVGLVRLEAANAYLEWEAATADMAEAKRRFAASRKLADDTKEAAAARMDPQLVVQYEAEAGRAQAEYVTAVFHHLNALAKLERVTAGGVRPDFPGR